MAPWLLIRLRLKHLSVAFSATAQENPGETGKPSGNLSAQLINEKRSWEARTEGQSNKFHMSKEMPEEGVEITERCDPFTSYTNCGPIGMFACHVGPDRRALKYLGVEARIGGRDVNSNK